MIHRHQDKFPQQAELFNCQTVLSLSDSFGSMLAQVDGMLWIGCHWMEQVLKTGHVKWKLRIYGLLVGLH